MSVIVPAVLPRSFADLKEKLELFGSFPHVTRVQIDVVDGRFATPASWPYTTPTEISDLVTQGYLLPFLDQVVYEVDLMCTDAHKAADAWLQLGATRLTVHVESISDLRTLLPRIKNYYGDIVSLGLALNIHTDLSHLERNIDSIEYVQFMGIAHIGIQGQPFDRRVVEHICSFHRKYPTVPIQVDGGVTVENAKQLFAAGVSDLIVGSGILRAEHPLSAFNEFRDLRSPFGV